MGSRETLVFADKDYDFRIPALLYFKEWKIFLAFAEKRTSPRDEDAKNLVMSKGTRQTDGSLQWSLPKDLEKAAIKGYRTMNPCPVFERSTTETGKGTLYLFFICLKGNIPEGQLKPGQSHLCFITSPDCGDTWSDLTDLTSVMVKKFPNYQTFAVGPGHGIQLSSGTLLVPAYVKVYCGDSGVKSYSVVLHSEDMNTWQVGQHLTLESGECQLAEVSDGEGGKTQVYLNARSTKAREPHVEALRVEALSDDSGESFKPIKLTLTETNLCQGSVLGFPACSPCKLPAGEGGSSETALLFSHPTAGDRKDRKDLGVYLRKSLQDQDQDPDPWGKYSCIIHKGASGYSDLTHCEEECHFGCLMESGFGEESHRLQIAFKEFHLKLIIEL